MPIASALIRSYPTPEEVLQTLLTAVAYAYKTAGIDINVAEGSEPYFRYRALASFVSVAISNGRLGLRDINPLDATGDALTRWAGVFGVSLRPATQAIGLAAVETILLSGGLTPTYASGSIPTEWRCTSPGGIEFKTTGNPLVTNGTPVELVAVDAGAAGNLAAGTVLGWNDASLSFLKPECIVMTGGISDGEDEDDEEDLRRNLLRRLGNPAGGGNPAQVQQTALNSSAAIDDVVTYPAIRGAASDDVVIYSTTGDRTLQEATIITASSAVTAKMPGSIKYQANTVNPQEVDAIINIAAPLPQAAGGQGGGFRDQTPWPSDAETGDPKALITASGTDGNGNVVLTVDSTSADPPKAGDRFGIWDPTFVNSGTDAAGNDLAGKLGKMQEFTIQSVGGSSGAYEMTLDVTDSTAVDFVVLSESRCSVGAEKLPTYGKLFMLSVYELGPGEKTDNPDILPFGKRNPGPGIGSPVGLTSLLLRGIANTDDNPEILDVTYAARFAAGTATVLTTPSLPSSTAAPPRILTLKNLSFRRLVL